MSKAQLKKVEKMTIDHLKQIPPKELARIVYNTAGIDDPKHELSLDAVPYGLYRLPTHDFRYSFQLLETVSSLAALYFWKSYALTHAGIMSDAEFAGVVLALTDAVEYFELDQKKVELMGMGASFHELAKNEMVQTNYCQKTKKQIFQDILDGASVLN